MEKYQPLQDSTDREFNVWVWLEVCKTYECVDHQHHHGLVEELHPVQPWILHAHGLARNYNSKLDIVNDQHQLKLNLICQEDAHYRKYKSPEKEEPVI